MKRLLYILAICLPLVGCRPDDPGPPPPRPVAAGPQARQELLDRIEGVLADTLENRRLDLREHAAWQILHGALAYQREFPVTRDGEQVYAVDYVLQGGHMKGWNLEPVVDAASGHRGVRALIEGGSFTGQGHSDQWLAILSQCNLPPEQPIRIGNEQFTIADFVAQVQLDLPYNVQREYSWTLIALTGYLPTTARWLVGDEEWSIERLVQVELEQDLQSSACGGTHRLIGLSMALNRHLDQGGELTGPWQMADEVIDAAIQNARAWQNPDGSFSTNYFARPGTSPDLAKNLGTTGHVVEFLALAMTSEQLEQDWVTRAVLRLVELFEQTRDVPLECGAMYHAAHGLVLYQYRMAPAAEPAAETSRRIPRRTPR